METSLHWPGHTAWSIAVVSLLAIGGMAIFLWRLRPGPGRRVVATLRLTALGGVLLAYLQPAIRIEEVQRARSTVLVIVDESASMQARDAKRRSRAEQAAEFFRTHSEWIHDLEMRHQVRWFACADHARPVDRAVLEAPLRPRGAGTNLHACVLEAVAAAGSQEVGGILLLSDGADPDPLAEVPAEPLPRAIGPLWVLLASGQEEPFRDIAVAEVAGLDFTLVRNLAEARVRIASVGVGMRSVTASLSLDGEVVDSKEVELPPQDEVVETTLSFLPREAGRHLVQVQVSVLEDEASEENNTASFVVTVVRDRLRVLHVAGHPSWDERFLRETLRRRRGVEMVSFHTLRDPETSLEEPEDGATLLIPFPAEEIFVRSIQSFDLIVLQDYEFPEADRDRYAASLERYVRGGGGLLFVGGSFALGAQGPWPAHLESLLPVLEPRNPRRGMMTGRFQAVVPIRARGHPVFEPWGEGAGSLIERISDAPPLPAINPLDGVAPGAETLIEVAAEPPVLEGVWPLVVVRNHDKGLVGLVATDTLWRWAFEPTAGRLYSDLIYGLVGYLTKDPEMRPVRVRVERDLVPPGQVFGVEVFAGPRGGDVTAQAERMVGPGRFEPRGAAEMAKTDSEARAALRFVVDEGGPHRITVALRSGGVEHLASDVFVVGHRIGEVVNLQSRGRVARALVSRLGGEVHPLSAPALDRFRPRRDTAVRTGTRVEIPIWNHPSVLLMILAFLGLEWYLERRLGQVS